MTKTESMKERMRAKLDLNKCKLEEKSPNNLVFKIEGEECQEKSTVPMNDDWLDEPEKTKIPKSGKNKKGKSGKK